MIMCALGCVYACLFWNFPHGNSKLAIRVQNYTQNQVGEKKRQDAKPKEMSIEIGQMN